MRIAPLPLILVVLALGLSAAPASASTADAIIKDCSNSPTGLLTGSYAKGDLRAARKLVRGDIAEYTGCMDAINAALSRSSNGNGNGGDGGSGTDGGGSGTDTGGAGSGTGGDGSSGSDGSFGSSGGSTSTPGGETTGGGTTGSGTGAAPTAGATPAPAPVQQAGSGAPVAVGGETITPGIPASFASDSRALPTPLIAFLVLLAAGAIGFGAPTIGRRVLARRRG